MECSDSEAEDEDGTSAAASAQRSQEQWNRLQATLAEEDESIRNTFIMPVELMVPPPGHVPALDRDFSQMSAISVGEDFALGDRNFSEGMPRFSDDGPDDAVEPPLLGP